MSQERKRRDGTKTVANTIYISGEADQAAEAKAQERNAAEEPTKNKWTKSKVLVDVVECCLVPVQPKAKQ